MDAFENLKEFSPKPAEMEDNGEEEDEESEDESDEEEGDEDEGEGSGEDEDEEDDEEELGEDEEWETDEEDSQDVTLVTSDDDGEGGESCPICLNKFRDQDIGTPESCDHCFCLECIQEWANNVNTCPVDRQVFHLILAKHAYGDQVFKKIPVEDKKMDDEDDEDPTYCEICGRCDREDRLLLCDGCDQGYHCECLNPPLNEIPVEEWFCPDCAQTDSEAVTVNDDAEIAEIISENDDDLPSLRPQRRLIARTRASERVREQIIELRLQRADRVSRRERTIISSEEEDNDPSTSQATSSGAATIKKTPTKRKASTTRKKRKTTKKRKSTPGKKKSPKKRKGKKRRKRRKKTTKTSKRKAQIKKLVGKMVNREVRKEVVPSTVKSRIARNLGLSKPRTGTTIPLQKLPVEKGLDNVRSGAGIAPLSVMGDRHELLGFSDEPDEVLASGSKSQKKSKYSTLSLFSHRPVGKLVIKVDETPAASSGASGFDILGSIMDNQAMLSKDSKDVTIHRDGSLSKKKESPPVRRTSIPILSASQPTLYDDLPPLEDSGVPAIAKSPEKETQTTESISDESLKEIKYLDRHVETSMSPSNSPPVKDVIIESVQETKKFDKDKAKDEENDKHVDIDLPDMASNQENDKSDKIDSKEDNKSDRKSDHYDNKDNDSEVIKVKTTVHTNKGSSENKQHSNKDVKICSNVSNKTNDKSNVSENLLQKKDTSGTKTKERSTDSQNILKENSKKNPSSKHNVQLSQFDDVSDESNGFHDFLEEKELEEKLLLAKEKLRKLEGKGKKSSKKDKKEKEKEVLKEKQSDKGNSGKSSEKEKDSAKKDKSDSQKDKKKSKESTEKDKKSPRQAKESLSEKTSVRKVKATKDGEYEVVIATLPPQEIEIIEIPDDDDESEYVQNLDKKIIKSFSGSSSQKSKSKQNADLKSVVKREKEASEKENRRKRESERDKESDRKKKKKYRSRSRSREKRQRSRSYERSRRSRSKSYDRSRRSRSRSYERTRRSRSREKYRSRKSRSRSRERSRRSRDRGWSRDKSRERNRSRDRSVERTKERDRSRKRKHRNRSKDRSGSREKTKTRDHSRDKSRERWKEVSPEVNISLPSGRLDTGRLIDLFDDKWKKREDLKQTKKKKKKHSSPTKDVQSPVKRHSEDVADSDLVVKKAKTPIVEKSPEHVESVQPIPKIMHVFTEKQQDQIDMFADDNSDMDTDIPEPAQESVIVINTIDNVGKIHSQRPNLVPLPQDTIAVENASKDSSTGKDNDAKIETVINTTKSDDMPVASPEYDPAFPTDDMEESPLMDEKSPPGTPVEFTHPPVQVPEEPLQPVPITMPLDENFAERVSPNFGKGILGEGGPLMLQRGEAPIVQPDVPMGIRLLQGLRPGMSPQRALLMNPLVMNRPPQLPPRFARLPPGHIPPMGLPGNAPDGMPFPPGLPHGRLPQPGLLNGIQTDTSQPPPTFQLLPGGPNQRHPSDPRLQLPPHFLTQGPPPTGAPLHMHPGLEPRASIPSPLMAVSGPPIEGAHLTLQGPPPISLSGPLPRLAIPLSIPSSQIRIPSPDVALGNPLTKLPSHLSRLQVPISNPQVGEESINQMDRPYTPPTPTNDDTDTPFINQSVSGSHSPMSTLSTSLLGNKPLISIANLKSSKTLLNAKDVTSSRKNNDGYPSPSEKEDKLTSSNKPPPMQQTEQLTQLTKLLNAQAQLAQLVNKQTTINSQNNGKNKPKDNTFKVPLPPRGKTSNSKVKEDIDVIDMDVASPLEESSIDIPDSPDDFDKAVFGKKGSKSRRDKHHKHKDKKVRDSSSKVKFNDSSKKPVMTVNDENLKDVIRELELDDVPSSAVELTNKEKFLKKLHLQERVVDEVKHALKPFYSQRKINKEQYKEIMRKAVPKVCHSKSGDINPQKIATLVEAYVEKYNKKKKPSDS